LTEKKRTENWAGRWWFPLVEFDHIFIAYLPNKDQTEKRFNVGPWETKALKLQGKLFGGATSFPARGSYRVSDQKGKITAHVMIENTRMVTSFIAEKEFTEEALKAATDFLVDFGRKTNQQVVAFVADDDLYYIPIES
jgi:hypothetical protein